MLRWLAVALVACGSPAARQPEPVVPPAPATQTTARIGYADTESWIDIAIDGIGDPARQACEAIVAREHRRVVANLKPIVVRACAATALPATRVDGVALVDPRPLDLLDQAATGADVGGMLTHVSWFATVAECERARAQIAGAESRADTDAAIAGFTADQRRQAEADEQVACGPAKTCAPRDVVCEAERDDAARHCASAREHVEALRRREATPAARPARTPRCLAVQNTNG